jgi:methyl-accepting chemotaxis protein
MDLQEQLERHQTVSNHLADCHGSGERLDAFLLARPLLCELGAWLHNDAAAQYKDPALLRQAVDRHNEFHRAASDVAKAINVRRADVPRMLAPGSPYVIALNGLEMTLRRLLRSGTTAHIDTFR